MNFNRHSQVEGTHAFLGASNYHWLNYTDDRLILVFRNQQAKQRGTLLHAFAATCINLRQKLPKSSKTLNQYVNDAIGFKMKPEVTLYFSNNCYGTADSISFKNNTLRIHDLKTGSIPAHIEQLRIYAAIFCLEYKYDPFDISFELRIYQNDDVVYDIPEPDEIKEIMEKIRHFDEIINNLNEEESM